MSLPLDAPSAQNTTMNATRPFYWSVRRELWENRSIYLAPLIVAGVVLFAFLIAFSHGGASGAHMVLNSHDQMTTAKKGGETTMSPTFVAALPFEILALILLVTGIIVGLFYCLGALHNERRDRSILFWKSMPVSNLTSVLAKAAIPMAVIPAVVFVIITAAQLITLFLAAACLAGHGQDIAMVWRAQPFGRGTLVLIYALLVFALWYAPIYAWILLVSAWAKNMTFLWAVAPPLVLSVFERIAFSTSFVGELIKYRLSGVASVAFSPSEGSHIDLENLDPIGFLTAPGLWLGLIAAALMLAAVVWLRRRREPI